MNRQEKAVAEQFGLVDPVQAKKELHSEVSHEVHQVHYPSPVNQDFMMSEAAEQIICDPDFGKIYNDFMVLAEKADVAGEIMPNLPQEDDAGPIEYKLRLTNLTLEKVRKRTTQMAFRLKVRRFESSNSRRRGKGRRRTRSVFTTLDRLSDCRTSQSVKRCASCFTWRST